MCKQTAAEKRERSKSWLWQRGRLSKFVSKDAGQHVVQEPNDVAEIDQTVSINRAFHRDERQQKFNVDVGPTVSFWRYIRGFPLVAANITTRDGMMVSVRKPVRHSLQVCALCCNCRTKLCPKKDSRHENNTLLSLTILPASLDSACDLAIVKIALV